MPPLATAEELDAWVLATAGRAVAYARTLLHDPHSAEDVVQDCYCRLLQNNGVYDLPRDGLKLLLTSISNACINLRTRRKTILSLSSSADPDLDGVPEAADPRAERPDQLAEGRELERALADALPRLPEMQRAALELKSWGHSQQEISEILGVTPTHAGVLVYRARQTLNELLAPFLEMKR